MSEDARVTALLEAAAERDAAGGAPLSDEQAAAAGGEESGASGANEGLDEVQLAASSGTPSPARSPQPQQPPAAPVDGAAGEAPGDAQPRPQASPLPQQSVASPRAQPAASADAHATPSSSTAATPASSSASFIKQQPRATRRNDLVALDDVAVERPNYERVDEAIRATRRATANSALVLAQRSKELFAKPAAKRDLVTTDAEVEQSLARLKQHTDNTKQLRQILDKYIKQMDALYKSEADLAQFLQVEGVRTPTVVGTVMSTMGHAVKSVADYRKTYVRSAVKSMQNNAALLGNHVLPDVQTSASKVEKARVEFDAQKNHLKDKLNSGKPMPAEQEAELRSRVDASAKDFEQIKKDVSTKLLMAEDHRLRMFNSMLEDYQVLLKTLHEKASNTLQDTVTQQKMAYEGEARSAVL